MAHLSTTNKVLLAVGSAALALMLIGGLALLMLLGSDSDDDETTAIAPTTTTTAVTAPTDQTTTTTLLAPETTIPSRDDTATGNGDVTEYDGGDEWHEVPTKPLPPMGIATAEFDWTVVELPLGEVEGDVYVHSLSQLDGRYVATIREYDYQTDGSHFAVFESVDGVEWTRLPASSIIGTHNIDAVFPFEGGLIATGRDWDEGRAGPPPMNAFITNDGRSWTALDLSPFATDDQEIWINGAAGTESVLVLSGSREPYWGEPDDPENLIVTIDQAGMALELNHGTNGYLITDAATGAVILQGDMDRIYECCEYGLSIYDPVTGEVLFTADHEIYRQEAGRAYRAAVFGEPLVIEFASNGSVLTIDEFEGVLTLRDGSGALVYTGVPSDLWRGRPPTFVDPATNEAVLVIPWAVWEEAHQGVWGDGHYEDEWYEPDPWLLRSSDGGRTFTEVGPDTSGGWYGPVFYGPDGFAVVINEHSMEDYSNRVSLWVSADGIDWAIAVENLSAGADWVDIRLITEDGLVAIFHDQSESTVMASPDGVTWMPMLSVDDLGLPLGSAWFDRVAVGELGEIVTGNRGGWEPYEESDRTFTKNGLTLTETNSGYLITNASGAVIFEHSWSDEYYLDYDEGAGAGLHWGEGGVVVFANDGTVIFAASHEELEEFFYSEYEEPEFYYEDEPIMLFRNGGEWAQVPLPDEIQQYAWFSGILVGQDEVIMSTSIQYEPSQPDDYWRSVAAILVGTPR